MTRAVSPTPDRYARLQAKLCSGPPLLLTRARVVRCRADLDITTVYDGSSLKGQRVLITGAEQGLGFELVKEIVAQGGHAIQAGRNSSEELDKFAADHPGAVTIISGVDVCKDDAVKKMCDECKEPVDILINCAGYFYGPAESVGVGCEGHLNSQHQLLQARGRVHAMSTGVPALVR